METVLFDPGYSSLLLGISDSAVFVYNAFKNSLIPPKQKKFQFSMILPKIKKLAEKNTAFYLGCLLWGVYIKSKNALVENNPCLNGEFDENSSLDEIFDLIKLIKEDLNKDSKYYLNKPFETDIRHIQILEMYVEFIKLNNGFIKIEKTDDIIFPSNIKMPDKNKLLLIKEKIDETLLNKDLTKLYEVFEFIL